MHPYLWSVTIVRAIKIKEFERFVPKTKIESGEEAFHKRAKALVKRVYGIEMM